MFSFSAVHEFISQTVVNVRCNRTDYSVIDQWFNEGEHASGRMANVLSS